MPKNLKRICAAVLGVLMLVPCASAAAMNKRKNESERNSSAEQPLKKKSYREESMPNERPGTTYPGDFYKGLMQGETSGG